MQPTPDPQKPARRAPLELWRIAEAFLHMLYTLFGAPEDVARSHTLTKKHHALLLSWLRTAEALMRRLLLLEAAAFPKETASSPAARFAPARVLERRPHAFDPDAPEQWRVGFRCFMDRGRPRPQRAPLAGGAPVVHTSLRSAWPLAERYEALIRVFNDPRAVARRLARRLHAAPLRLADVLQAPPEAHHRIDAFETLTQSAERAWKPCPDSS